MSNYFYTVTAHVAQRVKEMTYIVEANGKEEAEEYVNNNMDTLIPVKVTEPFDYGKPQVVSVASTTSCAIKKHVRGWAERSR